MDEHADVAPLKRPTRVSIAALQALALLALGWGVADLSGLLTADGLLAVCFVIAFALATMFPLQFAWHTRQHLDTVVILAAALIFAPGVAMAIVAAGAVITQAVRRESWAQFFFNSAQMVLQVATAAVILRRAGWDPSAPAFNEIEMLVMILVAGAAIYVVNTFAVAFIIGLESGVSPVRVWLGSTANLDRTETLLHLGQVGVALLAAIIAGAHRWALALLLLPPGAMYVSLRHHVAIRARVEETLRGTEANLREAQRLAHLGSWEWNLASGERLWSREVYRILAVEPSEADSQRDIFLAAVAPDDRDAVENVIGRALRGETPASIDHQIVLGNGDVRFVHSQLEVVFDRRGRPERMLATLHDITERKQLEERLAHQAFHDPLTGLPNRALFTDRLQQALARAQRQHNQLAVLFIDLDHFKLINDTLGHDAGDQVLNAVAARIRACLRPSDSVARLGGDEFTVLLEDLANPFEAEQIAARITAALAEPFKLAGQDMHVTTSVGIVLRADQHRLPEDLLRDADVALYRAKDGGRARYAVYDASMGAAMIARVNLEADLRRALERGELTLYYQPQVDLVSGGIVAAEALVRWLHPERGTISPDQFLPVALETTLINAIDGWVIAEACRQGRAWSDQLGQGLTLSVNISARQFRRPELPDNIAQILALTGFDARNLKLELTEVAVMANTEQTTETLAALLRLGVRVVIDDFGTGYSSLTQLKRFPIDTLKLDGALVQGLGRDTDAATIAKAIIGLAHSLGLKVVAEGIERIEQVEHLRDLGCEYGQGNLFSAPLNAADFSDWLGMTVGPPLPIGHTDAVTRDA